ncbi:MAG TPA: hypothetical protein VLP43_07415 [Solirubrobacteraceae bacterium]|nr:hypothetical protein [Solirubrobacteraceae bacterium]
MPRFRRPSPAIVPALLALMVALSSSAGANPIAWAAKAISGKSFRLSPMNAARQLLAYAVCASP